MRTAPGWTTCGARERAGGLSLPNLPKVLRITLKTATVACAYNPVMLRALFVGVLAVSAVAGCGKKSDDAPKVAVGTAAGKVIELSGKVSATRDGKTRDLAQGGEVFGDDQIETAADGAVTIELFHNGAHWSVIANKKARVDASLAWSLDKQAASKTVEQSSAAAGRNAERSAADTAATAATEESAPAPKASADTGGGGPGGPAPGAPAPAATTAAPPPPPAAEPAQQRDDEADKSDKKLDERSRAPAKPAAKSPPMATNEDVAAPEARKSAKAVISPQELADHHRDDFKACLDPKHPKVTITIHLKKGKPTVAIAGDNSAKVKACATDAANKIEWLPVTAQAKLTFE